MIIVYSSKYFAIYLKYFRFCVGNLLRLAKKNSYFSNYIKNITIVLVKKIHEEKLCMNEY